MNPEASALIEEADRLLGEAEERQLNGWENTSLRLAYRAQRLRKKAIALIPDRAERLALLLEFLFTADATGDQERLVWGVRQAVLCGPGDEVISDLRDYWECGSWILKGDKAFPEPPQEVVPSHRPLPGQMSFLEGS